MAHVVGDLICILALALDNDVLIATPQLEVYSAVEMSPAVSDPLDVVTLAAIVVGNSGLEVRRSQLRERVTPAIPNRKTILPPVTAPHPQTVKLSGQRK